MRHVSSDRGIRIDLAGTPISSAACPFGAVPTVPSKYQISIVSPRPEFAECWERISFAFEHSLSGSKLFELGSLIDLVARRPDNAHFAYWSNADVQTEDGWDKNAQTRLPLVDTLKNIGANNSFVMLKRAEQDAAIAALLHPLFMEILGLCGAKLRSDVRLGQASILVASPGHVTPYHIDAESNFLFQLTGDKIFHVFDHIDRTVVSDEELEAFHSGEINGAIFKSSTQISAQHHILREGCGAHVPVAAPHWAKVGDRPSIALSVNFTLRSVDRLAKIYRQNRLLRRLGIKPSPPGVSLWRDQLKAMTADGIRALRSITHRHPASSPLIRDWVPPACAKNDE